MDEMERYRMRLQGKWNRRVTKRNNGGRRKVDYKAPSWFTVGDIIQFVLLLGSGIVLLVLGGCTYIKKMLIGG